MRRIKVKLVADWQEIDYICDDTEEEAVPGIYIDKEFLPLDEFLRYGTPWVGDSPECETESGEVITIHGVSTNLLYPYLIEINGYGDQARLWEEIIQEG